MRPAASVVRTLSELIVAILVAVGAWVWMSGVSPHELWEALVGTSAPQSEPRYDVVRLGWHDLSTVCAISDAGQIVGMGRTGDGYRLPVLWSDGETTPCSDGRLPGRAVAVDELGRIACSVGGVRSRGLTAFVRDQEWEALRLEAPEPGADCKACDMNRAGVVVGVVAPPGQMGHACVWDTTGAVRVLDTEPSCATGISDSGVVAGFVLEASAREVPRLWVPEGDSYRPADLREHFQASSRPRAISNQGVIVGALERGVPFRWDASGGLQVLPVPDRRFFAMAQAINDRGEIVGYSGADSACGMDALLWRPDGLVNLNDCIDPACGWHLLRATAIGNGGMIGCDAARGEHVEAVVVVPRAE